MKNNLLVKTILSCLLGVVVWAAIDFIMCMVNDESFVDTFFSITNIVEVIVIMICAGIGYYIGHKNK